MDYASYDCPSKQSFDDYGRSVKNGAKRNTQDLEGDGEFCVFTTVRWDPMLMKSSENAAASCNQSCPIYMLEHHWTRLQVAKWSTSFTRSSPAELLRQLLTAVQHWLAKNPDQHVDALRLKHKVYADSRIVTDVMPVPRIPIEHLFPRTLGRPTDPPPSPEWEVYLDDRPTEVSETTMYKTSERFCYDRARATAGIKSYVERKEVLLFNPEGEIMDGSITSVYFWRDGQWVTPESTSGGQQGTTRRWTFQKKLCTDGKIYASDLRDDEVIWLSNASKGYFRGRFVSKPAQARATDDQP